MRRDNQTTNPTDPRTPLVRRREAGCQAEGLTLLLLLTDLQNTEGQNDTTITKVEKVQVESISRLITCKGCFKTDVTEAHQRCHFFNKHDQAYSCCFLCFLLTVSYFGFARGPVRNPVHLNRENNTMFLPIDFLFSLYNCCHKA